MEGRRCAMTTTPTVWRLLRSDSSILRGAVVYRARKFYPPDIVEAWKNTLKENVHRWLEWQYIDGHLVELHCINGDAEIILDEIRARKLDLATFAHTYKTSKPH
jgi:hypothetical protein